MPFGWFLMVAFWVGIVALVAWLIAKVLRRSGSRGENAGKVDPMAVVKERYARGEITKEQFDQIKRDLQDR